MDMHETELQELARRLRYAREATDLTREEAAELAEMDESELALYETAQEEPRSTRAKMIALAYGVSMDWLMGMTDEMRPEGSKE